MKKARIVSLVNSSGKKLLWKENSEGYRLLDEKECARQIKGYSDLSEKARKKQFAQFLSEAKITHKAETPAILPNTSKKLHTKPKRKPNEKDHSIGIAIFLSLIQLFENPATGFTILSSILCGLRCEELREQVPNVHFCLNIPSYDHKLIEIFVTIVEAIVTKSHWGGKHCKIKRFAVMDYRNTSSTIGRHVQDFSLVKIQIKKGTHITTPMDYSDTVVLVICASSAQLREAAPYLENACVFLLGCDSTDWKPEKLSADSVSAYNPEILNLLQQHQKEVASALRIWWGDDDEENWAKRIVAKAKASFGRPDSNYISVTLNPEKLRKRIQYNVLLSYFDEVEKLGLVRTQELEQYRQAAKQVFDPAPIVETPPECMGDPNVFLELMGQVFQEQHDKILQEHEPFVKAKKPFAAYRTISNERHLIMLESTFKTAYAKAARNARDIDTSFLAMPNWEKELQKLLCEAGTIKAPNSGYRYRYDLYKDGTRDTTYVVAIPCELLENSSAKP